MNRSYFETSLDTALETQYDTTCDLGDRDKCYIIFILRKVTSSLTLIGCLLIILLLLILKVYQQVVYRLTLYLAICGTLHSIAYLFNDVAAPSAQCTAFAWLVFYSEWAMTIWMCCLAHRIYQDAVNFDKQPYDIFQEVLYNILSWGISLLISLPPFYGGAYGDAGEWCWIIDNTPWRFGLWFIPLIAVILALVIIYVVIQYKVRRLSKLGQHDRIVDRKMIWRTGDVNPLIIHPIVYLLITVLSFVNRIQNVVDKDERVFVLTIFHAIFAPLQSSLNVIIYGCCCKEIRRALCDKIRTMFSLHMPNQGMDGGPRRNENGNVQYMPFPEA